MNSVRSEHTPRLLLAHRHQGASNDCAPFTVAMVVQALTGQALDARALARRLDRPRWRGVWPLVRRVPGWATFPWGVTDALRVHGVRAAWRPLARETHLHRALAHGVLPLPIFGGWRPRPWAHIAVLVAWEAGRGWGFVDPATPEAVLHWWPAAAFRRAWRAWGRLLVLAFPEETDARLVS